MEPDPAFDASDLNDPVPPAGTPEYPESTTEIPVASMSPEGPPRNDAPPPSWAWSAETGRASAPAATVDAEPKASKRSGGGKSALIGGVAGALVGALIAGGLVAAFDDDPEPQPVRTQTEASDDARPATVIVEPGDIRSILEAARPAVVRIDVGGPNGVEGTGTGFVIDSSGVIVTNAHVVDGSDTVMVHLADGRALEGDVIGADTRLDLAVVQVDEAGLPTLELGNSDDLQVGDAVVAIGNALGLSEGSGATVTTGIISG
ncbi:MAG: trypsin-like peptidase domain-containing protein, partial [Acidimicrobiia bacterium]